MKLLSSFLPLALTQKPIAHMCSNDDWLLDENVVCSKGNLKDSYCTMFCPKGLEPVMSECLCGKQCKWMPARPYCADPADYEMYYVDSWDNTVQDSYTEKPEISPSLNADSVESPEGYKAISVIAPPQWTNKKEETTSEYTTTTTTYAETTTTEAPETHKSTTSKSAEREGPQNSGKRTEAEKAALKYKKQQERKQAKKAAKLNAKEKAKATKEENEPTKAPIKVEIVPERVCSTPSWFDAVSCSNGVNKNSVCETSCYGQGLVFDRKEMKATCQCTEGLCDWDNKDGPSCVIIKTQNEIPSSEKDVPDFCEELEWLDSEDVICSEKNHKDSVCLLKSCSRRQISTAVKCKCYTKSDDVSRCKWQEELKDDFTKRGNSDKNVTKLSLSL